MIFTKKASSVKELREQLGNAIQIEKIDNALENIDSFQVCINFREAKNHQNRSLIILSSEMAKEFLLTIKKEKEKSISRKWKWEKQVSKLIGQ